MTRISCVLLVALALPTISGCASSGSSDSGLQLTGNEKGGKIPRAVGAASTQSSAFEMLTAHCAKFGKKGFITQMDFESGTLTFECVQQKAKLGT